VKVQAGVIVAMAIAPMIALLGGCGLAQEEDGTGYLTVADLAGTTQSGRFTGTPALLVGELRVTPGGCVTVLIAGVERVPLWPKGTRVAPEDDSAGYTVDLPGSVTLKAGTTRGGGFEAVGVVGTEGTHTPELSPDDSKLAGLLGFCGIPASPVAFFDPDSVRPRH
jgi:hypothetical protein